MLAKMSFLWNDKSTTCQKDVSRSRSTKIDEEKPKNVDVGVDVVSDPKDDRNVVTSKSKEDDVIKEATPKTSNVDRDANDSISNDTTKTAKDQEHTESKTKVEEDDNTKPSSRKESEKSVESKQIEKSCNDDETSTTSSRSEKSKLENEDEKSPTDNKESEPSKSTKKKVEKSTKGDDKTSTKKIPTECGSDDKTSSSKKVAESGSKYKRKLEEEKSLTETDSSKDDHEENVTKSKPFSKVKKIKRSHTSEVVSKLKTANAISSSLSSSLLEKEEQSRVGKRKLRSPEQGINERKFPKKESEKVQQVPKDASESFDSGEESEEEESVKILPEAETQRSLDDSFQLPGHPDEVDFSHVSEKSNIVESFNDNSFLDETGTSLLVASETEESPYAKIPVIEEVDRRHEIADVEALERDRERDRARAEKLLSAFDDSD